MVEAVSTWPMVLTVNGLFPESAREKGQAPHAIQKRVVQFASEADNEWEVDRVIQAIAR